MKISNVAEKYYMFTFRQWVGIIITAILVIPLYKYTLPILGDELSSWLVIFVSIPPMAFGFVSIQGLHIEKILPYIQRQYISFGKPLEYKTEKEILEEKEAKKNRKKKIGNFGKKKCGNLPQNPESVSQVETTTKAQIVVSKKQTKKEQRELRKIARKKTKANKKLEKKRIKELQVERKQAKELAKAKKKYGDWESNTRIIQEQKFSADNITEDDLRNIILLGKKAEQLQDIMNKEEDK